MERRKDQYRIRRSSKAEFSRVTWMLHTDVMALEEKVESLEKELKSIKNKLKRIKTE